MKLKITILLITLSIMGKSYTQKYYTSIICDRYDSSKLSWVSVYLKNNININTTTDSIGKFIIYLQNISNQDSLCFSIIGYNKKTIHLNDLSENAKIYLERSDNVLPEIQLTSKNLDWEYIIKKSIERIDFNSKLSFESNFNKQMTISKNETTVFKFKGNGYNFDQGINYKELLNNRNQFSWSLYTDYKIDLNSLSTIIDYNGSILQSDTYFENRTNKYLLPLSLDKYTYTKIGIEKLDKINVYKIEVTPKNYILFNLIDRKLFHNLYKIMKTKKTFYINSQTFDIIKIEFSNQTNLNFSGNMSKTTLEKFDGVIQFYNNYNTLIPSNIIINHYYFDNDGNNYKRTDLINYSNISISDLSNNDLQLKYNLRKIYGDKSTRQVFQNQTLVDKIIYITKK
jgi:hypothetical protein